MSFSVSGSIEIKGETYYCGEIGQAAKNLFIWRRFAYPASVEQLSMGVQPAIIEKGRCRTMSQAQSKLQQVSIEVVAKLKSLQKIILEDAPPAAEIQLEQL